MNVYYVAPLRRAWARMKGILFRPFNLGTWLVIGFSAWLAGLAGGGGGGFRFNPSRDRVPSLHVRQALRGAWEHLRAHPNWLALIIVGAAVLAVIVLLLLWISSRGKFIFLDNVVHGRARIVEPWRRFAQRGDSLFFWRLGFVIACIFTVAVVGTLAVVSAGGFSGFGFGDVRAATITALAALAGLVLGVACAYVSVFLDGFVVPVMYKDGVGAVEAWRRLLPRIEAHLGSFLLYGLFLLGLAVALGVGVVVAGLLTCCVGLLLVALPYVGTVILLPFLVTYRAFSLEFLAQFDAGFAILPEQQPPPPDPA
ncbi:MAG: hypothetical protein EPN53_01920 [Acidobacteria bacterium]|nr:MAG: hypothetical protein EPN53_01920 [Acidobacteriota bacterium]